MANEKAAAAIEQRASRPTDPVFKMLVEHAESAKTSESITALRSLMQRLGADLMQVSLGGKGLVNISINTGDMHYDVWHRPDGRVSVESYVDTIDASGDKVWTAIDNYDTRNGVAMANGITREGGA